jgi:hypothetical protein
LEHATVTSSLHSHGYPGFQDRIEPLDDERALFLVAHAAWDIEYTAR